MEAIYSVAVIAPISHCAPGLISGKTSGEKPEAIDQVSSRKMIARLQCRKTGMPRIAPSRNDAPR